MVLGDFDLNKGMRAAAEIAGRLALRMTHDHELYLDYKSYDNKLHELGRKVMAYRGDLKVRRLRGCMCRACSGIGVVLELQQVWPTRDWRRKPL